LEMRSYDRTSYQASDEFEEEFESSAESNQETGVSADDLRSSKWSLWLLVSVPIVAVAICGSGAPWAVGMVCVLMGLCMVLAPPQRKVPAGIVIPALLVLLLSLTALLPASFASAQGWRTELRDSFGIDLGTLVSPQPLVTFEKWLLLCVGVFWMLYCLGRGFGERERQFIVQKLMLSFAVVAVAALYLRYQNKELPSFWQGEGGAWYFGPFPNRNNFSGLCAISTVLGFASIYGSIQRRNLNWLLYALTTVPLFAALLLNTSRLGVVIFFAGLGVWMMLTTTRRSALQRMAVSASVLLTLTAVFLIYGRGIIERFTNQSGIAQSIGQDGRITIFRETAAFISHSPLTGVGLGNFEPLFNFQKTKSDQLSRAFHPENDWLWLGAETGILVLLLALAAFFNILRHFGRWRVRDSSGRRERPLRTAVAVSVLMLAVLGFAGGPLHTLGLASLAALLTGTAVKPRRVGETSPAKYALLLYPLAGLFCIVCGSLWMVTASGKPVMPGNSTADLHQKSAARLTERGDFAGAIQQINSALAIQPLNLRHYDTRALLKLRAGYPVQSAFDDFGIVRHLEPFLSQICHREAQVWLQYHPPYAVPAYREAMRRDPSKAMDYFQDLLSHSPEHPALRQGVRLIAQQDSKLMLRVLASTNDSKKLPSDIARILSMDPDLKNFTSQEKVQFFRLWYARGDKQAIISKLEENSEWRLHGWSVLADHKAAQGDFRGAYELANGYVTAPFTPSTASAGDLPQLKRNFLYNPTDFVRGFDYYEALKAQGKVDEAMSVLNQTSQLPGAPIKLLYEQAVMFSKKGDYSKAWERLMAYLQKIPQPK